MKLKDLLKVIVFDTVCLYYKAYEDEDPVFEDIYEGKKENVPKKYLEIEVKIVGAKKKNVLDIQLYEAEILRMEKSS